MNEDDLTDDWQQLKAELDARVEKARRMGGRERIEREHAKGKLIARERVDLLLDDGSFDEWGVLAHHQETHPDMVHRETPADGLVAGTGTIDGRPVVVAADDATVMAGSRGIVAEEKLSHLRLASVRTGAPMIFLQEASGGRIQELMGAAFAARSFRKPYREQLEMSGWVPQVGALLGSCFGGPAFVAGLSDFVPITRNATVGASGPPVVAAATGEEISEQELGSAQQAVDTGLADTIYDDDPALLRGIRDYLGFFPSNSGNTPPTVETSDPVDRSVPELEKIVTPNLRRAYDMREVLRVVADQGDVFEVGAGRGQGMITGYVRLGGLPVAVVANQPMYQAGVISAAAARKTARFIRIADSFHMPIVFLVDTPGFIVGTKAEREGLAAAASSLLAAIFEATVPKMTLILRKSYGLGFFAMNGPVMLPDVTLAWPTASISQMGPEAATDVIYRRQIDAADDPQATRQRYVDEFREQADDPYTPAGYAAIDDVIKPADTREVLTRRAHLLARMTQHRPSFKRRIPPR